MSIALFKIRLHIDLFLLYIYIYGNVSIIYQVTTYIYMVMKRIVEISLVPKTVQPDKHVDVVKINQFSVDSYV